MASEHEPDKVQRKGEKMANLSLSSGVYRFCIDGTGTALKANLATVSSITAAAPAGTAFPAPPESIFPPPPA
jgi:hypothetical protein